MNATTFPTTHLDADRIAAHCPLHTPRSTSCTPCWAAYDAAIEATHAAIQRAETVADLDAIVVPEGAWGWGMYGTATAFHAKRDALAARGRTWIDDPYRETTHAPGIDALGHWSAR